MDETIKYLDDTRTQELIDEIKRRLDIKQNVIQVIEMPENPTPNVVYQYVGDNTIYAYGDYYYYDLVTEKWIKVTYNVTEINELLGDIGNWDVVEHPTAEQIQLTANNIWGEGD